MSEQQGKPHLSVVTGERESSTTHDLTRAQVAARLGVSISTVRRYEGERLHFRVDDGVHYFAPSDVARLARELVAEREATPRGRERAVVKAAELSRGELAALVFERLEQRQSLAEIVIGLRVPPDDVRTLYHSWLTGLWAGELKRSDCALPERETTEDLGTWRDVKATEFEAMLAALPDGVPTRISVSRVCDEVTNDKDEERRYVVELGGFEVHGPMEVADLLLRYGSGVYHVAAYGFEGTPGLRWQVRAPL